MVPVSDAVGLGAGRLWRRDTAGMAANDREPTSNDDGRGGRNVAEYDHTQSTWLGLVILAVLLVIFVPLLFVDEASTGFKVAMGVALGIALAAVVLLSRLRVKVVGDRLITAFGWGWPKRMIQLDKVAAKRPVRNKWWYGLGIRKVPRGWMFNVWGLDAVELEFESGRVFRVGTDEPDALLAAIGGEGAEVSSRD